MLQWLSHCNVLEQMYLKPIPICRNVILAAEITAGRLIYFYICKDNQPASKTKMPQTYNSAVS